MLGPRTPGDSSQVLDFVGRTLCTCRSVLENGGPDDSLVLRVMTLKPSAWRRPP